MHAPTPAILPAATMACKLAEISLSGALLSAQVQLAVTRSGVPLQEPVHKARSKNGLRLSC